MTRAAIYARTSSEDERSSEAGKSVDRQVALAREFIVRQGWTVADEWIITDDDYSGADFTRPGLIRLLTGAKAKPRPFDAVVTMHVNSSAANRYARRW